jgi:site-specific recombinase XerD
MVTVHTLHSFATHLLVQGVDIRIIQDLLGHRHVDSTARYARVAINTIRQIKSPVCTENPIRVYRMIESAKLARWSR